MNRSVRLTSRAQSQVQHAFDWYAGSSSAVAQHWYEALIDCLKRLPTIAHTCPLAAESPKFPVPIREVTFGSGRKKTHRILFVVRPDAIIVYAVRHLAQDDVSPDNLE